MSQSIILGLPRAISLADIAELLDGGIEVCLLAGDGAQLQIANGRMCFWEITPTEAIVDDLVDAHGVTAETLKDMRFYHVGFNSLTDVKRVLRTIFVKVRGIADLDPGPFMGSEDLLRRLDSEPDWDWR